MDKFLTNKTIFYSKQTVALLALFFVIRIASLLLVGHEFYQGILVFLLLLVMAILYFKNPEWAWRMLLTEIFLGGSGHYFELAGLSIRTLFIATFLFLWFAHHFGQKMLPQRLKIQTDLNCILLVLFTTLIFATVNGFLNKNGISNVIQDLMPFGFLLLLFPSLHSFSDEKTQHYLVRLIAVFIIGTALFTFLTFVLFSTQTLLIHLDFYKWFRDVNVGKITDMGTGFFRIVEPSHLFIVPIILLIASLRMRAEKHNKMWWTMLILSILILVMNLSRGYFLALAIGLLALKYKHTWKKWFLESMAVFLLTIGIFTSVHLFASNGTSPGWELFGLRLKSFVSPEIEVSTDTRMMILPQIWEKIKQAPILGSGLGEKITFMNTATYETITTPHFDWGYLEMWTELGIIGALAVIALYVFTAILLIKKIKKASDWRDFDVGLLAGIIAFLVMNTTMPALFHVFGILFLVLVLTVAVKQMSIFEQITATLYRIFNKLRARTIK
ncbi:MAG: O-antigen ligase family protein [Candidatus Magasanikbacteria bacterium]|nr:O-antigen ligase family protein [Candidatus Magasanikbacteria bacterium]